MESLGFARFHYPGEITCTSGMCTREVLWEQHSASGNSFIEIDIPSDMLIPLSLQPEERLSLRKEFSIVSADLNIDPLKLFSHRAGWNQTESDLELLVHLDPRANFLACYRSGKFNIPLGSGTVMPVAEQLYWIGMILVHPQVRRQGIARKIMQHCINHVRQNAPGAAIGLDATPEGYPLYKQLGFKTKATLWRCQIDIAKVNFGLSPVEIKGIWQVNEILDYAQKKQIRASRKLLTRLFMLCSQGCFAARADQECVGFVMSRPGRVHPFIGPLFADNSDSARSLLAMVCQYWYRQGYEKVFIDVTEDHFCDKKGRSGRNSPGTEQAKPQCDHLLSECIHPVRPFFRMLLEIPKNDLSRNNALSPFLYATFGPEYG